MSYGGLKKSNLSKIESLRIEGHALQLGNTVIRFLFHRRKWFLISPNYFYKLLCITYYFCINFVCSGRRWEPPPAYDWQPYAGKIGKQFWLIESSTSSRFFWQVHPHFHYSSTFPCVKKWMKFQEVGDFPKFCKK